LFQETPTVQGAAGVAAAGVAAAGVAAAGVAAAGVAAAGVGDAAELEQAEATSATTATRAAALRLLNICPFLLVEWMRIAIRQATVFRVKLPDLLSAFKSVFDSGD
jgi:hypothetical protein